jgi:hypothetical protein
MCRQIDVEQREEGIPMSLRDSLMPFQWEVSAHVYVCVCVLCMQVSVEGLSPYVKRLDTQNSTVSRGTGWKCHALTYMHAHKYMCMGFNAP